MNLPEKKIILRSPSEDDKEKIKDILENIKKDINKPEINTGYIKAESGIGKAVEEFYSVGEKMEGMNLVDKPGLIDEIIQTKDKD